MEGGSSSKDSNDPVADFEVEEPSYQDMLHGNVRRMSNTVRKQNALVKLSGLWENVLTLWQYLFYKTSLT